MRRALAVLVFAVAAGMTTAAGSGVIVAPQVDPPGTPVFHTHVFAAYRLRLFLGVLRARFDPHQGLVRTESLFDTAAALVLALIARALWHSPLILGPPRRALHA